MYSTPVYHYIPRQIAVMLSGTSPRAYMQQYAKPLTLHKGVDNQLQFQFLNQEQKRIDITGKDITCRIISADGSKILLTKSLTLHLPVTGIAALQLGAADIENIEPQKCYYSLEIPNGSFNYPVFVDHNAGGRGDMIIVDSILPSFTPSFSVSIPTSQTFPDANANVNTTGVSFYSSVVASTDNPILTFQATYTGFTGNVSLQGSTVPNADWYTIDTYSYANAASTAGYTIQGYHPYVRMEFVANCGSVTNLLVR